MATDTGSKVLVRCSQSSSFFSHMRPNMTACSSACTMHQTSQLPHSTHAFLCCSPLPCSQWVLFLTATTRTLSSTQLHPGVLNTLFPTNYDFNSCIQPPLKWSFQNVSQIKTFHCHPHVSMQQSRTTMDDISYSIWTLWPHLLKFRACSPLPTALLASFLIGCAHPCPSIFLWSIISESVYDGCTPKFSQAYVLIFCFTVLISQSQFHECTWKL